MEKPNWRLRLKQLFAVAGLIAGFNGKSNAAITVCRSKKFLKLATIWSLFFAWVATVSPSVLNAQAIASPFGSGFSSTAEEPNPADEGFDEDGVYIPPGSTVPEHIEVRNTNRFIAAPSNETIAALSPAAKATFYAMYIKQKVAPITDESGHEVPPSKDTRTQNLATQHGVEIARHLTPEELWNIETTTITNALLSPALRQSDFQALIRKVANSPVSKSRPDGIQHAVCDALRTAYFQAKDASHETDGQLSLSSRAGFAQRARNGVERAEKHFPTLLTGESGNKVCPGTDMRIADYIAGAKIALQSAPTTSVAAATGSREAVETVATESTCTKDQLIKAFADTRTLLKSFPHARHAFRTATGTCKLHGTVSAARNGQVHFQMLAYSPGMRFQDQIGKDLDEMIDNLHKWMHPVVAKTTPVTPAAGSPRSGRAITR